MGVSDNDFRIEAMTRLNESGDYSSRLVLTDGEVRRILEVPGEFATVGAAELAAFRFAEPLLVDGSRHRRIDRH